MPKKYRRYDAIRHYYLKYSSRESYSIVDASNTLGIFMLFLGRDQLGEDDLTYSKGWGWQSTVCM